MEYKDYYAVLGVARTATEAEIKSAYKKLARKYHPDVSKLPDAEVRFKELGEAYKVLKVAETRAAYDRMGSNWKAGQDFKPPPDWDAGFEFGGGEGAYQNGQSKEFSDLFESLFGRSAGHAPNQQQRAPKQGEDHHAKILIDLQDTYQGAQRSISLQMPTLNAAGQLINQTRTLNVNIPKGVHAGQHLRLVGQGSPGASKPGDLFLQIGFRPHRLFRLDGRDVYFDLPVAPWEAMLGANLNVPTPDGSLQLSVPPGSAGGRKLRLKGKGIPSVTVGVSPGDLYAVLQIALPPAESDAAKTAYRDMELAFDFDPRELLKG